MESLNSIYKSKIAKSQENLPKAKSDAEKIIPDPKIIINGKFFEDRKDIGNALELEIAKAEKADGEEILIGKIGDLELGLSVIKVMGKEQIDLKIKGDLTHFVDLQKDNPIGNITRILNAYEKIPQKISDIEHWINRLNAEVLAVEKELAQTFPKEKEYKEKSARYAELLEIFRSEKTNDVASETEKDDEKLTENGEEIFEEAAAVFDTQTVQHILNSLENYEFPQIQKDNFALFKTIFPEVASGEILEKTVYVETAESQKLPITVRAIPYNPRYMEMVENDKVFNFFVDNENEILTPSQATNNENLAEFLESVAMSTTIENAPISAEDLAKIAQNEAEDRAFKEQLDRYIQNPQSYRSNLLVCSTPYSLQICGANPLNVEIRPETINKIMSEARTSEIRHPHSLPQNIVAQLATQLRNPVMIMEHKEKENSLVIITDIKDLSGSEILVAVDLDVKKGNAIINRVPTMFGKENMANYISDYFQNNFDKILAYNKEKAEPFLRSITHSELLQGNNSSSLEGVGISFDNSAPKFREQIRYRIAVKIRYFGDLNSDQIAF